jgi:hypothetical protein
MGQTQAGGPNATVCDQKEARKGGMVNNAHKGQAQDPPPARTFPAIDVLYPCSFKTSARVVSFSGRPFFELWPRTSFFEASRSCSSVPPTDLEERKRKGKGKRK